jgi:Tfp pilus assembly protein PilW
MSGSKQKRGFTPHQSGAGFSLAELMVAVFIFTVISSVMLLFFIQASNLWQQITNQSDLRSAARNAINFMSQELRSATRTSTANPSPNVVIPSAPNNNSLDFYLPFDTDGNGSIIDALGITEWDTNNKIQYQYVPSLKRLLRLEASNQHIIANDVSNIEFQDHDIDLSLSNEELRIVLTLERIIGLNRTASITVTSIVKLRNQ